jgi:flagellar basal-body rod modification protein FlgD
MEITASTNTQNAAAQATNASGMKGISGEDFMNVLVKQLQMQDPFKPMGNEEMLNQISTIRELEMNTKLSDKLQQLTDDQRYGAVAALIGKQVSGSVTDESGNTFEVEGVVSGIRFNPNGDTVLELDTGETLPISKLQSVTDPEW